MKRLQIGLVAGVAAVTMIAGAAQAQPRVRKNIKDQTAAEQQLFVDAMLTMQKLPPRTPQPAGAAGAKFPANRFEEFVRAHNTNDYFIHRPHGPPPIINLGPPVVRLPAMPLSDPWFLPWHRQMLYLFENDVRGLGGRFANFTLPYWDGTQDVYPTGKKAGVAPDPVTPADPTGLLGGDGRAADDQVTTGPFANPSDVANPSGRANLWRAYDLTGDLARTMLTSATRTPLRRRFNNPDGGVVLVGGKFKHLTDNGPGSLNLILFGRPAGPGGVPAAIPPATTYDQGLLCGSGSEGLESAPGLHDSHHQVVGGNLAELESSSNDPTFWLLHSYTDLCWARWECMNGPLYDGLAQAGRGLNAPMEDGGTTGIWGLAALNGGTAATPSDVLNFVAMGYTYQFGGTVLGTGGVGDTCKGSCCIGAACTITARADCPIVTGTWTAVGSCTPDPCPALSGACCSGACVCTITTKQACFDAWTSGVTCTPGRCAVPTNDDCANAIPLVLGVAAYGVNCGSTADGPNGTCGGASNTTTVWWKFTPTATGSYQLNTCGSTFDTVLEVYSGGCGAPGSVACNDDSSSNTACPGLPPSPLNSRIPAVTLAYATTYLVRVRGFNSQTGSITIVVTNNNPLGVCCTGTGAAATCAPADSANCAAPKVFTPGGVCTLNPCTLPTGACCAPAGTCAVTTLPPCTGAWTSGGVCSPNTCPTPGVCCRGATCTFTITSAAACTASLVGGQTAGANFRTGAACNATATSNVPCCYADYNKVGGITIVDIFDFLADWFANRPYANTGGTGAPAALGITNIFDFLTAWFAGGCLP